ncbi:MAG: dTMP kinase [Myxococcota bacterium]
MSGRFIVLEGLDGAGTTTQSARLARALRAKGRDVVETHEPTDGPVGRLIRQALQRSEGAVARSTLPWMFAADRADHLSRLVEPTLRAGGDVISDRYLHSSLAYQSLDYPLEDIFALNASFRVPDLTIFVDVSVDTCLARISARGEALELFERRESLEAISAQYTAVFERLTERGDPIVHIDGDAAIEHVAEQILNAVQRLGDRGC